ncbi:MAG: hypothetical protein HRT36_02280 [Alphaproteobacteria bacterium]|nr:hypothetical protein [Alphaproteobacteria bacterium]
MTVNDYNQDLDALESALALLAERLETPSSVGGAQDIATLHAEIARLEENQANAQTALHEATQLIRQMLSTESA